MLRAIYKDDKGQEHTALAETVEQLAEALWRADYMGPRVKVLDERGRAIGTVNGQGEWTY